MRSHITFLLVLALGGAGCRTMAPEYARPAAPVPGAFPDAGTSTDARSAADLPWQSFITDASLRTLVSQALESNRDLRTAALNIERAQALYRIQRSALLPAVNGTANGVRQRIPEGLFGGAGGAFNAEQYSVGVGVSNYELDIFGRIRSLNDVALQRFLATEQVRRAVQITLVAEVSQAYLTYAADQERLALSRRTLDVQQQSQRLAERRLEAGISNALAVRQAETTVAAARADVARFTALIAQDRNALALVIGRDLDPALLPAGQTDTVTMLTELTAGLPSAVLQQRPDILAAEHQLQAANANIGVARANFFPAISLTGSVGTASRSLGDLFTSGTGVWSFIPNLVAPIFNAGRNRATLEVSQIDRELAVAAYEQAIQGAFRDVADALAVRSTIDEELAAQQALQAAAAESLRLAEARFRGGVDSYLPVLDATRVQYTSQQGLIAVRLARAVNSVALYRALGGGWTEPVS